MAFECELYVAVVDDPPTPGELRAFWNVKENNALADLLEKDRIWIGRSRVVTPEEPDSPGPAGRVFDLLRYIGTTPTYVAPQITESLIRQIMDAFGGPTDPELPAVSDASLESFLTERRGQFLLPDEDAVDW